MRCRKCSHEISINTTRCNQCGAICEPIILRVTSEEARDGCKKRIHAAFMANTILVTLQPGVQNGRIFQVRNAKILCDKGEIRTEPIYVKVSVGKVSGGQYAAGKKKVIWPWFLLIVLFLITGIFAVVQGLFNQTEANESSTTLPIQTESSVITPGIKYESVFEIPHFKNRIFLSQLDEDLHIAFCAMYDSIMLFESDCEIPVEINEESFNLLIHLLNSECPELMQIDYSKDFVFYQDTVTGMVKSVQWNYAMDRQTYLEKIRQCQDVVNALIATTEGMSHWDKQRIVFDYLANSCTYSAEAEDAANAFGAMVLGEAKCDGISLAYKWIMEDMGYRCFCLYGEPVSDGLNHAWNVVEIDGKFLDVDVTADVRYPDREIPILYQAYNVSDNWVRKNYKLDPVFDYFSAIPGTDSMEYSHYAAEGLFISEGTEFEEEFEHQLFLACDGRGYLAFQFESKKDMISFVDNISSLMNKQAVSQGLYGWSWECITFDAYQVVYLKMTKN